jgi:hypothetical protein
MTETQSRHRFAPAKDATSAGRVGWLGILLAVVAIVLGVLCVREALVAKGTINAKPWLARAADKFDGLAPSVGLAVLGVVVALIGLWLVVLAFWRRRRTRLPVSFPGAETRARSGVTIGVGDAARLARVAAEDVDEVLSAKSKASRRKVTVTVTAPEGVQVEPQVRAAVEEQLSPLSDPMAIKVVTKFSTELR